MSNSDQGIIAVLSLPYTVTKSRLGACTKIYTEKFICNPSSISILYDTVAAKLATLNPKRGGFSYLLSFDDSTHIDNHDVKTITKGILPIGKATERLLLKWIICHEINGEDNEIVLTIRISNPINPLLFLQAALSKSPQDIDNAEFEMGSTCVSLTGAGQLYADEVFRLVQLWIDARPKTYSHFGIDGMFKKNMKYFTFANYHLLPFLVVTSLMLFAGPFKDSFSFSPESFVILSVLLFWVFRDIGKELNARIQRWANTSAFFSVFEVTSGDGEKITKMIAKSKSSSIKLCFGAVYSIVLNLLASAIFLWYTK